MTWLVSSTLLFSFNLAGLINSARAESGAAGVGKDMVMVMVMLPWDCGLPHDQLQAGMLIPRRGEAAWLRPEGHKACFVGQVKTLRHERLRR